MTAIITLAKMADLPRTYSYQQYNGKTIEECVESHRKKYPHFDPPEMYIYKRVGSVSLYVPMEVKRG